MTWNPNKNHLTPVVRRVDNAIYWINLFPLDSAVQLVTLTTFHPQLSSNTTVGDVWCAQYESTFSS